MFSRDITFARCPSRTFGGDYLFCPSKGAPSRQYSDAPRLLLGDSVVLKSLRMIVGIVKRRFGHMPFTRDGRTSGQVASSAKARLGMARLRRIDRRTIAECDLKSSRMSAHDGVRHEQRHLTAECDPLSSDAGQATLRPLVQALPISRALSHHVALRKRLTPSSSPRRTPPAADGRGRPRSYSSSRRMRSA